jgi:hypothetical protein
MAPDGVTPQVTAIPNYGALYAYAQNDTYPLEQQCLAYMNAIWGFVVAKTTGISGGPTFGMGYGKVGTL